MANQRSGSPWRRLIAATGAGAMLAASLGLGAGAIAADGEADAVTIAIPGWAFSLNPQIVVVAQQYSDEHPDQPPIELTLNPLAQETLDTSRYLLEASEGRSSFDAWFGMTPFIDLARLIEGDVLEPWDAYIPAEIREDIFPANLSEGTWSDGSLYSWPQVASAVLLAYRPSMLEAAGVEPPRTWDEVLSVSEAVEAALPGTKGLVFDLRTWRSLIPLSVSQAGSGEVFGADGYLDLSHPATLAAVELMAALGQHAPPDILTPTGDVDAFRSGLAAMMIKYVDAAGTAARVFGQDDIAITTLPTVAADSDPITVQWGTGFALFKHGANKDIAADFVAYLTNSELYQRGWVDAAQSSVYQSWQEKLAEAIPTWMDGQADALASATFIPPTPDFVQWHTIVRPWMERVVTGELGAAEALEGARAEVESTLGTGG